MKWTLRLCLGLVALAVLALGWMWHLNFNDGVDIRAEAPLAGSAEQRLERGAYLARVGNCLACHTARRGPAAAGGRRLHTEFGTVFSSNLTPDRETGIGDWTANGFWRALHHGRSADGRLLVPVFPYPHTTLLTRADSDALYSYFMSLPPETRETPPHELRWPLGTQLAQMAWRTLYFRPGSLEPDPAHDEHWNRGAYLVRAVAHCSACHAPRNALGGADWRDLSGGLIQGVRWYAPSLVDADEAGLADWHPDEIARLLRTGVAERGRASGPMAETVLRGTQYLDDEDLVAIASYLRDLPPEAQGRKRSEPPRIEALPLTIASGRKLYENNCADCHGMDGSGHPPAYPALAGNRNVTLNAVDNLLQTVLFGGFNAATPGYPRPFGMPPFAAELKDDEIAAILTYIRNAWGNDAGPISGARVHLLREASALAKAP